MYSECQLSLAKKVLQSASNIILHLDATGSVIRKTSLSPTFLYSLILPTPIKGEPSLPLLEWLSDSHNSRSISSAMFNWWLAARNVIPAPNVIVTDFSWALLHSVAHVFNHMSLENQLKSQWKVLTGECDAAGFVSLRLCASHYIKALGNRLTKMAIGKQVRS